ncbi:MAG TPA: alpha/beta hydrolase [Ferruginibacter sp.]|jgi:pimeloyl-ACP methyl ester carboxylesterase|nr:alpha/beta hydrolase [Ferruginibacter sp.]
MKNQKILLKLCLISIAFFSCYGCFAQADPPYGNNPGAGKYFNSNGTNIYYEIYGEGKPLVLLHGNGGSIRSRANMIGEFAKKYKVIALDSRCHGKSGCPSQYLTYEQMAEDVNALLQSLHIDSAFIWGHSDGAILGLLLAIHHPDKVKKLLASGANLRPDTTAIDPALLPLLDYMGNKVKNDSTLSKQFRLLVDQPNIPVTDLEKIKGSVLIMAGDRDAIRNRHTLEIFEHIPNALLCIMPGTTHFVYQDRKKWFTEILYDFFDNPPALASTAELMTKEFMK